MEKPCINKVILSYLRILYGLVQGRNEVHGYYVIWDKLR